MKIIIHRGANQIGGCVTEISTEKSKILIDLGANLPGSDSRDFTKEEISRLCNGADAIFYTHYHGDHIGHIADVPCQVKQYIGKAAKEVMLCKYETLNFHKDLKETLHTIEQMQSYHTARSISINNGDINLTPYFVPHSAVDAYMFKIEVEGITILHTGDFRKHSYLGKGLIPTLKNHIRQADLIIIEGTMLSRQTEEVKHEITIQNEAANLLNRSSCRHLFALCSSTDIDRLASFHSACQKVGATFVCDNYQKKVLDVFTKYNGNKTPLYDFSDTSVIGKSCDFDRDLKARGFIMPIRPSQINFVKKMMYYFPHSELIYSIWKGYYNGSDKQINPQVVNMVEIFKGKVHWLHTSGHADTATLQEVCQTVNPRLGIIPIHKEKTSHFEDLPTAKQYRIISNSTTIDNITIEIK